MSKAQIEADLRQLGSQWPIRSVADSLTDRLKDDVPAVKNLARPKWPLTVVVGTGALAASALLLRLLLR